MGEISIDHNSSADYRFAYIYMAIALIKLGNMNWAYSWGWVKKECVRSSGLRENGGKCVAERIPITVIETFLSLQVHCRDAVLTHSLMGVKLKHFRRLLSRN